MADVCQSRPTPWAGKIPCQQLIKSNANGWSVAMRTGGQVECNSPIIQARRRASNQGIRYGLRAPWQAGKRIVSQQPEQPVWQPDFPPGTMALQLHTEHESSWQLHNNAPMEQLFRSLKNCMDTDGGLHERWASATEYRPAPDGAVQLAATASVQRRPSACRC